MKGVCRVLISGSGKSQADLIRILSHLSQDLSDAFTHMMEKFLELQDALMGLTDTIEEVLMEDADVVFGETTASGIEYPLLPWLRSMSKHARSPPADA